MAQVPNRDELERRFARALAKLFASMSGDLVRGLGDPPNIANLPAEFWEEFGAGLSAEMTPFLQGVFVTQAGLLIAETNLGVDWALINKAAADWAKLYTNKLVSQLTDTTIEGVGEAVASFFENALTRGELEDLLLQSFGPVRAEAIAVTEVTRAASEGEQEIARELAKAGIQMTPIWQTNNDELVCELCGPKHGKPIEDDMYPPEHPRCLPGNSLVLPVGRVAAGSERWYEGDIIIIETLENKLTVTPNHPILTPSGWISAGLLNQGDSIICYKPSEWVSALFQVDNQNRVTSIQDIFSSLGVDGFWVPVTAPDFHNDGAGSNIAVIRPNREVMNHANTHFGEPVTQGDFIGRDVVVEVPFTHLSTQAQLFEGGASTTGGILGGRDLADTLLRGHPAPLDSFRFGLTTRSDSSLNKTLAESPSVDPCFFSKDILRLAGKVSLQKIIKVRKEYFSGHVYNLQTESGLYVADGIITHNCRCWVNHEIRQ